MDVITLALAKKYASGQGQDGFSPIITENEANDDENYKLNIETKDGFFTTPNLKGNSILSEQNKEVLIEIVNKAQDDKIRQLIEHNVTALEIPYGTTKISDYQFQGDGNLRKIVVPDTVTTIGKSAFEGCYRLTGLEGDVEIDVIPGKAFYHCYSLTDVNEGFLKSIKDIGSLAFDNCTSLETIILPNCQSISTAAFRSCFSLTNLSIPNCTSIDSSAFQGCSNLTTITLPNCTSIGVYAFQSCFKLTYVDLGDNFNANNLNLSSSTEYTVETLVNILNSLKDRTSETAYTLTLGTTNLAKLTDEEKAIATNKNWILK